MYKFTSILGYTFGTENPTRFSVGMNRDISILCFHKNGLSMIIKWVGCRKWLHTSIPDFFGAQPYLSKLRVCKDDREQSIVIQRRNGFPTCMPGCSLSLFDRNMNNLMRSCTVPGCINIGNLSLLERIGFD